MGYYLPFQYNNKNEKFIKRCRQQMSPDFFFLIFNIPIYNIYEETYIFVTDELSSISFHI